MYTVLCLQFSTWVSALDSWAPRAAGEIAAGPLSVEYCNRVAWAAELAWVGHLALSAPSEGVGVPSAVGTADCTAGCSSFDAAAGSWRQSAAAAAVPEPAVHASFAERKPDAVQVSFAGAVCTSFAASAVESAPQPRSCPWGSVAEPAASEPALHWSRPAGGPASDCKDPRAPFPEPTTLLFVFSLAWLAWLLGCAATPVAVRVDEPWLDVGYNLAVLS